MGGGVLFGRNEWIFLHVGRRLKQLLELHLGRPLVDGGIAFLREAAYGEHEAERQTLHATLVRKRIRLA